MKRPVYLFSDSQLLFWKEDGRYFTRRFLIPGKPAYEHKAAYIGASNRDNPDYFEIFRQAMDQIDVKSCQMIPSKPRSEDLVFLSVADIVLLAGGEVRLGWEVMLGNGVADVIKDRYTHGATLIGISAGAIQLSMKAFEGNRAYDTLQLVPFLIDVHDEANDWSEFRQSLSAIKGLKAFGIPFGAGLSFSPDGSIKMLRRDSVEFQ